MGLFSNKKKGCLVCGEPTPRLFPTKIEGAPICKACAQKIYLPQGKTDQMSSDDFLQYMSFYEENQSLRDQFFETYQYDFGFLGDNLMVDAAHGLFRMKNAKEALVFPASSLKGFRILEGENPLFESKNGALVCHKSYVKETVNEMHVLIAQFKMERREYEMMERMEREREERARERGEEVTRRYYSRPRFKAPELFEKYYIELTLDHPYWSEQRWEKNAPSFDEDYPSIDSYLTDYANSTEEMRALAKNLMQLINPNAQTIDESASTAAVNPTIQQAAPVDTVEELKKYKGLLDAGIITEEEFAAKKRQLLGI